MKVVLQEGRLEKGEFSDNSRPPRRQDSFRCLPLAHPLLLPRAFQTGSPCPWARCAPGLARRRQAERQRANYCFLFRRPCNYAKLGLLFCRDPNPPLVPGGVPGTDFHFAHYRGPTSKAFPLLFLCLLPYTHLGFLFQVLRVPPRERGGSFPVGLMARLGLIGNQPAIPPRKAVRARGPLGS